MATSWETFKKTLIDQKNRLDSEYSDAKITSKVEQMNAALARYTNRAGISQSPDPQNDPDYMQAQTIFKQITSGIKDYTDLNKRLTTHIGNLAGSSDVQEKLRYVGELREQIKKLEKEMNHAKQDLDTSQTRQENVETPRQNISFYQGFGSILGFSKPLHVHSIPFLVGFGILMLFLSGLMLREFFSPSLGFASDYGDGGVLSFFADSRFYSVLAGMTLVFVVMGILAYSGYLGKRLN